MDSTIYRFLIDLHANNNREWFNANKQRYLEARDLFETFVDQIIQGLKAIDDTIEVENAKECVFRIYRDTRFSKNKLPYKDNFGAFITRGGRKSPFAGYYVNIEPSGSFVGGGIYHPDSRILHAVRQHIFEHPEAFLNILNDKNFKDLFPEIYGDRLKMAPKGFPKDFSEIELLKYKDYAVMQNLDDDFFLQDDAVKQVLKTFEIQKPFIDFLNEPIEKMQ
ncbi:TIGR02453 family protein [Candidatus Saccharibacteria bacterium]|nr:MAG: TIGR02453 family protein [Candidatus Saccharibacteria bacterium]